MTKNDEKWKNFHKARKHHETKSRRNKKTLKNTNNIKYVICCHLFHFHFCEIGVLDPQGGTKHLMFEIFVDVWGGRFDGIVKSLGFSRNRRMSLAFTTLVGLVVGFQSKAAATPARWLEFRSVCSQRTLLLSGHGLRGVV